MKKLFLINGRGGTGKTNVAESLFELLEKTALLDIDHLMKVKPWEFDDQLSLLGVDNASALIDNYFKAGYSSVVLSGGVYNQVLMDHLMKMLSSDCKIYFVWLSASKEVRDKRRLGRDRDDADTDEHFDFIDSLFPELEELEIKNGEFIKIDTSEKTPDEISQTLV